MNDNEIPIIKKLYELYKVFHGYRKVIPKLERYTVYERTENFLADIIELLLEAGYSKNNKIIVLEKASIKLNELRFFTRVLWECKSLDWNKFITLEKMIDEIGRMLGGWIKSTRDTR